MLVSGTAGGGHTGDQRFFMKFLEGECAPDRSSNWREFRAGLEGLKKFAESLGWQDQRVLPPGNDGYRAEGNQPSVVELLPRAGDRCGPAHITGVLNGLADRLSWHSWEFESGDWQIVEEAFQYAQHLAGVAFSLDGGADIVGSNSYLVRFGSVVDSFLDHSVEGEHVYTNPDFELILKYIVHFLEGQRKAPERTSGTFVLPVWMWATF
jgi:hypothetical protein